MSSLFASKNISIEALIQNESKANQADHTHVPVVIISGPLTDEKAFEMTKDLHSIDEIAQSVKQFRIHNAL